MDVQYVRTVLTNARIVLARTAYTPRFIAARNGEPCNPRKVPDAISIRGAIIAATSSNRDVDMVIEWLNDHHLLGREPLSKDRALYWFDRALTMTKGRTDVPRRLDDGPVSYTHLTLPTNREV